MGEEVGDLPSWQEACLLKKSRSLHLLSGLGTSGKG